MNAGFKKNKSLPKPNEMNFLDHLEELRWRLLRVMIVLFIGTVVCLVFSREVMELLKRPAMDLGTQMNLLVLGPTKILYVLLEIGFFGGLILTLPYLLYQVWGFISPGLLPAERRYFIPLMLSSTLLFAAGVSFSYFVILPLALNFVVGLAIPLDLRTDFDIDLYIGFIIRLLLVFGFLFQLPVVSYFFSKIGVLTSGFMKKYRRHAIILIFVIAAFLTPPDPFTQVFLGIPMIVLYEASIYIVKMVEKGAARREKEMAARYGELSDEEQS